MFLNVTHWVTFLLILFVDHDNTIHQRTRDCNFPPWNRIIGRNSFDLSDDNTTTILRSCCSNLLITEKRLMFYRDISLSISSCSSDYGCIKKSDSVVRKTIMLHCEIQHNLVKNDAYQHRWEVLCNLRKFGLGY